MNSVQQDCSRRLFRGGAFLTNRYKSLYTQKNIFAMLFVSISVLAVCLFSLVSSASADPYPPYWSDGTGPAIHFQPVPWPSEPSNPTLCGNTCGDWKPYTRFQNDIADPRTQDPSNGGTSPQNYVNIASSCVDKTFPSIYYYLYKHPTDPTKDVIFFRWRVEQIANTYATGPSAGSYGATDPWNSALWTVLFDLDGDGYIDLAAHLDGSSGAPSTAIDRIFGIWSTELTQSLDYAGDPNIKLIDHNPTAFVGPNDKILNFHSSLTPDENWPNGSAERSWDYGTTRSRIVTTSPCNEYFIDYQIPVGLLDASGLGGPKITRDTPISMLFCTSNSLNNPFQKDCALRKAWIGDAAKPAPFGDYLSFNQTNPYAQPIVSSVTATAPSGCPGSYTFTAKVQDTIAIVNGNAVTSVKAADFYYYYDANGNGIADDSGSSWTLAAHGVLKAGTLNTWTAAWNATSLPKGKYLIGVQGVDTQYQDVNNNNQYDSGVDISLLDDGMTPTDAHNRTFSYLTQAEVNALGSPPPNETWYANPDITGTQTAVVGVALNNCGVAPTLTKTASTGSVVAGGTVDFTLTVNNLLLTPISLSQISDTLPAGFSYLAGHTSGTGVLAGTGEPTSGGQTPTWNFSLSIPAGGSGTLTFRATASSTSGNYTNTASATTSFGALTSNPVSIGVDAARLSLTKTPSVYNINPDGTTQLIYTLSYSNDSTVSVTGASISDALPSGVTYVSCAGGNSCGNSGGTVTWSLGSLAGGATGSVTLTVTVNTNYSTSSLTNGAMLSATAPDGSTVSKTASNTIFVNVPIPAFTLTKTSSVVQIAPGGSVTWTITYSNFGTGAASGVAISDTLPPGFTWSSCSNSCNHSGQAVSWTIGTVAAGGTASVTVTATAANPFTSNNPATNSAVINWTVGTPVTATNEVGVTGSACSNYYFHSTNTNVGFDGTQKIGNVSVPTNGTSTSLAFTATTTKTELVRFYEDPATPTDVNFPAGSNISTTFYFDKANGPQLRLYGDVYDYNSTTGAKTLLGSGSQTQTGSTTSGNFSFNVSVTGTLTKGHRILWIISADSNNSCTGHLFYDGSSQQSGAGFCVTPPANLTLSKSVDKANVNYGTSTSIQYTLSFSNTGQTNATGAQVVDTLPAGVTFVSATLNGSSVTPGQSGQQLTFSGVKSATDATAGQISGSASGTIVINATVSSTASGVLTNNASISSNQTNAVNATATTTVGGSGTPALSVSKAADKTLLNAGDTVTYTLTVVNTGTGAATNVQASDTIPAQSYFSYVAGSITGGDIHSAGGNPLTWTINNLAVGSSATLTFQMRVAASGLPSGVSTLNNSATATATGGVNAASNVVAVTISGNPNLNLTKTAAPNSGLKPGDTVTYTLTVSNSGSGDASGVEVTDPLPNNLSFSAITQGGGTFDSINNRVIFNIGALSSGTSATLSFTATVNQLSSGSSSINNIATVTASNASSRTANASVSASASPTLILSKTAPAQVAYPAATLTAGANNATTLFVNDTAQLLTGQYVSVGGITAQIFSTTGNTVAIGTAVTAPSGTNIIGGITYILTYKNTGNASATNVILTDTLPGGSTFVSATNGGSNSGGSVTWNLGSLDPGAGGSVQVVLIPGSAGTLTNNASLDCTGCSGPVSKSANTSVGGLVVTKTTSTPTTAAPGSVTYVIEVDNTLGSSADGVTVTDTLPSGFNYASTTSALIDANPASPTLPSVGDEFPSWGSLSIPGGKKLVLTFTANVDAGVGAATYQNGVGSTSTTASVTPFDPLLTTAEDVTVLANNTGIIEGYVFQDNNNNGIFEPAIDTPLTGVTVNITDSASTLYRVSTDSSGYFSRVVSSGSATVDINDSDIPSGLNLGGSFTEPATVTVLNEGSVRKDTGYISASSVADVTTTVTAPGSANAGSTVNLGITFSNNGPATASDVTYSITLPTGLSGVGCSGSGSSCTYNSGTGVVTITGLASTLTNGQTESITLSYTSPASGSVTVTTNIGTSTSQGTNTAPDTANGSTDINPIADVTTTVVAPGSANAGSTVNVGITFSNNGPSTASGVTYSITLSSGLSGVSCTGATCSYDSGTGVVTITGLPSTLTSGQTESITLTYTAPASGSVSVTTNIGTGTSEGTNTATDTANGSTPITAEADLSITKTASPDPAVAGQTLTYTITVSNSGPSDAQNVVVTDTLPANVTLGSASGCTGSSVLTCNAGTIAAGGSKQYSITVTVNTGAAGTLTNTASVTSDTNDPNSGNNSAAATTTVNTSADLSITKTADKMNSNVNDQVVFTLSVTNHGPSDATGVEVTDILPTGLIYLSDTSSGKYNNGIWNIGSLNAGSTVSINITARANQPGKIVNIASITASAVPDPDPTNNSSGLILNTGSSEADLSVEKTVDNETPNENDQVVFTITVTNNGPDNATGVKLTDQLPSGLTYVSDNSGGAYVSGTGLWDIGDLNVGIGKTLHITAQVSGTGEIMNTAKITASDQTDPDTTNNQSSSVLNQTQANIADLAVQKTVNQSSANFGGSVVFTIIVRNNGPDDAHNVEISDVLPSGLSYLSSSVSQGTYSTATGVWTIGTISAGAYVSMDIDAQAIGTGMQSNTASASADEFDPDSTNNSSTGTVALSGADLSITKTDGSATAVPGSSVTYTIVVTNNGPSDVTGATVGDTMPGSLTGVTWTCTASAGSICAGSGSGDINDTVNVLVGGTATYTVTGTVSASAAGTLSNTATVTAPNGVTDPTPDNNSATDTDTLTPSSDLSITKSDGITEAVPGQGVTYTIIVSNNGPSDVMGATVSDTMPGSLTNVTWTCAGTGGATCTASSSGNINDTVNIPVGGTATYTVSGTVSASTTGTLVNTATVSAPAGTTDPNTGNNSATDTDSVASRPNLAISKTHSGNFMQGQTGATYTIIVTNIGLGSTSGTVSVVDTLPTGLTATAINGNGWSCNLGTLTCTRSNVLLSGSSYPAITVIADIANNAPGSATNAATVSGGGELDTGDDTATDPATITPMVKAPVVVPTLNEWGMLILMVLAGVLSTLSMRRRKQGD